MQDKSGGKVKKDDKLSKDKLQKLSKDKLHKRHKQKSNSSVNETGNLTPASVSSSSKLKSTGQSRKNDESKTKDTMKSEKLKVDKTVSDAKQLLDKVKKTVSSNSEMTNGSKDAALEAKVESGKNIEPKGTSTTNVVQNHPNEASSKATACNEGAPSSQQPALSKAKISKSSPDDKVHETLGSVSVKSPSTEKKTSQKDVVMKPHSTEKKACQKDVIVKPPSTEKKTCQNDKIPAVKSPAKLKESQINEQLIKLWGPVQYTKLKESGLLDRALEKLSSKGLVLKTYKDVGSLNKYSKTKTIVPMKSEVSNKKDIGNIQKSVVKPQSKIDTVIKNSKFDIRKTLISPKNNSNTSGQKSPTIKQIDILANNKCNEASRSPNKIAIENSVKELRNNEAVTLKCAEKVKKPVKSTVSSASRSIQVIKKPDTVIANSKSSLKTLNSHENPIVLDEMGNDCDSSHRTVKPASITPDQKSDYFPSKPTISSSHKSNPRPPASPLVIKSSPLSQQPALSQALSVLVKQSQSLSALTKHSNHLTNPHKVSPGGATVPSHKASQNYKKDPMVTKAKSTIQNSKSKDDINKSLSTNSSTTAPLTSQATPMSTAQPHSVSAPLSVSPKKSVSHPHVSPHSISKLLDLPSPKKSQDLEELVAVSKKLSSILQDHPKIDSDQTTQN